MVRSFSNRLFGGVCGGFARSLPFNAWIWRLIFILLTLVTGGAVAIWYVALWWMLPLDAPLREREGGAVVGFVGILLGIAIIGLYFGRSALELGDGYWGIAFLLLSLVFLLKQIFTGRLQNLTIGLVFVAVPVVFLLRYFDVLQAGADDILLRAAPAILVFLGLTIALRYRVRFGSWVALIISLALVAGLVSIAFSSRVDVVSSDNQITLQIPDQEQFDQSAISDNITTLGLTVNTGDTDVTITLNPDARNIEARFVGSNNSEIQVAYTEDGDVAAVQILEIQANDFPLLQDIGRGELTIEIPANIGVFLTYNSTGATISSLDMGELSLERLTFTVAEGDVLVRLPQYNPLSPAVETSNGNWVVGDGNLRVVASPELGTRFSFPREDEPSDFNDLNYQLLIESGSIVLASRQYDNLDAQMQFDVDVTGGRFSLENVDN